MSDTFTPSNRYSKQLTGSNQNVWGDILNNNFDLLEERSDGILEKSLTGNVTLTVGNAETSEARKGTAIFSDGGLTAPPTVTYPAQKWVRFIINAGATHAINISVGNAVAAVRPGTFARVRCDGVNCVADELSLDQIKAPTDDVDFGNQNAVNVADGTESHHAITKGQLDNALSSGDIATVAAISADVTTVAGISADVTAVAADVSDIGTVSTNITDVNTVAGNMADVQNASALVTGLTAADVGAAPATHTHTSADITDLSSGGTVSLTVSGAVTAGGVAALQSDGTVAAVLNASEATGTAALFQTGSVNTTNIGAIDATRSLICYRTSNDTRCVVAEASGTALTFGSELEFNSNNSARPSKPVRLSEDTMVWTYGYSGGLYVVAATVSGTTVTLGTPRQISSSNPGDHSACRLADDKIAIVFSDSSVSNRGRLAVCNVTGTTISSHGGLLTFTPAGQIEYRHCLTPLSSDRLLLVRMNTSVSKTLASVISISGLTASLGADVELEASVAAQSIAATLLAADEVLVVHNTTSLHGKASLLSISGTTITVDDTNTFESATTSAFDIQSLDTSTALATYVDGGNSNYGTMISFSVSGGTITPGTATVFESAATLTPSLAHLGDGLFVIAYEDDANSDRGTAIARQEAFTSAGDWLGIFAGSATDAAVDVTIMGGIATGLTGLSPNAIYYVADDGSLTTTTNSRKIGRALSATELLITEGNA